MPEPTRNAGIDGLRGLAILMVIAHHWIGTAAPRHWPEVEWIEWPLALGVDVFFVVSGFLIGRILLDGHTAPGFARAFLARRAVPAPSRRVYARAPLAMPVPGAAA
jgi:peptidoglycan/LPS O-acetylase OafA/YrhL